ncbi:hypothetical protein NYO98_19715 [Nocardioides sp. STR2]|uniref:Uncharacterized protein n=1 Tax=Nocardioides pini TaxID=2975053 RepID=A0ABT4CKI7_9ACTN|nr:hypothetical protein [Nocardioides pini]MCY4728519.1 hypothetical protein [Nocardioides pini]
MQLDRPVGSASTRVSPPWWASSTSSHLSCGVRRREDTVHMRSIRPDVEVNTSRW